MGVCLLPLGNGWARPGRCQTPVRALNLLVVRSKLPSVDCTLLFLRFLIASTTLKIHNIIDDRDNKNSKNRFIGELNFLSMLRSADHWDERCERHWDERCERCREAQFFLFKKKNV